VRRGDPEVALRRRADPVRAVPEVHAVEIELQDLRFRELGLEPHRDRGVLELAPRRAVVASQVEELRELLGQRAAALRQRDVARVVRDRSRETDQVDPVVTVEALVLGGDDRPLEDRRDGAQWDEPTAVRTQPPEDDLFRSDRRGGRDPRGYEDARQEDDDADDAGKHTSSAPQGPSLRPVPVHSETVGRTRHRAQAVV